MMSHDVYKLMPPETSVLDNSRAIESLTAKLNGLDSRLQAVEGLADFDSERINSIQKNLENINFK